MEEEKRNIEMGVRIKEEDSVILSKPVKIMLYMDYMSYLVSVILLLIGMFGSQMESMIIGVALFIVASVWLMFLFKAYENAKKKTKDVG